MFQVSTEMRLVSAESFLDSAKMFLGGMLLVSGDMFVSDLFRDVLTSSEIFLFSVDMFPVFFAEILNSERYSGQGREYFGLCTDVSGLWT